MKKMFDFLLSINSDGIIAEKIKVKPQYRQCIKEYKDHPTLGKASMMKQVVESGIRSGLTADKVRTVELESIIENEKGQTDLDNSTKDMEGGDYRND